MLDFYAAEGLPRRRFRAAVALSEPDLELRLRAHRLPVFYLGIRRCCEVVLLMIAAPVLVVMCGVIAFAILLDSGGPVLRMSQRVGRGGRIFRMPTFCATRRGVDPDHPFLRAGTARMTRMGRFLRSRRLDALPQVWSVLRGEMSLIGPLPESPEAADRWMDIAPLHAYRWMVRPGLTGWARIEQDGARTIESSRHAVELDLEYILNISPWFDLKILLRSMGYMVVGVRSQRRSRRAVGLRGHGGNSSDGDG